MQFFRFLTTSVFVLLFTLPSLGGRIDPPLAEKISKGQPEEKYSVLIQMADQVDMKSLKLELKAKNAKLAERHKRVIESLKSKAEQSQRGIVAYLEAAQKAGRISDFRTFWIANLIWVESPSSEIHALSARPDVEVIFTTPKVELVKPVEVKVLDYQAPLVGPEIGLKAIKAPQLWSQGIRGKGRLVCNIDTGVDRTHPTLSARWRGFFLPVDKRKQAWFDPAYNTILPNDNKSGVSAGHGTGTMSVICGANPATGDTVGVAPEALWIAAQAIDLPVNWPVEIEAMQWACDPDGDPNTLDDVPDVVNNSWGLPKYSGCTLVPGWTDCWEIYWQVLDNLAAAGPVVVFAAGNEGTCNGGTMNLRNPADRIVSPLDVFSVGAVDGSDTIGLPIASFSSRGPSYCDGSTIKPEVTAPGVSVRAAYTVYTTPYFGFASWTGTSFSAPHVAGAAALLKQINPNATSEEVLNALYVTARDKGPAGEDNSYGRGVIDVFAAKNSLPALSNPHVFISDWEFLGDANGAADPGENVTFSPTLINDADSAWGVQLTLSSSSPLVTITDPVSNFGDIPKNDTLFSFSDFTGFSVSASAQAGDKLPFTLSIQDDSGYSVSYPLVFYVTAKPLTSKGNHDKGNFVFTVSNFGQYGFGNNSFNEGLGADTGVGFRYPKAGTNNLFEAGVLFGIPTGRVSDGARDYVGFVPDSDFAVGPGGELIFDTLSGNRKSDQDGFAIYTDEKAEIPIGIRVVQRSYVYSDTANDDYVIFEFTVHNRTGSTISGLRAGFFTDWDFPWLSGQSDRAHIDTLREMGFMHQSNNTLYRGIVITDTLGLKSFRAIENGAAVIGIYDGFTDIEKWQCMSGGFVDTSNTTDADGSMLAATGPWDIPAGDSIKTSLAIAGATTLANLRIIAQRAIDKYRTVLMCVGFPGDVNGSNTITLGDVVHLLNYLFDRDNPPCLGTDPGNCWELQPFCRGDVNASATLTLGDVISLLNYLFDRDNPPCLGVNPGNCWTPVASSVCCQPVP